MISGALGKAIVRSNDDTLESLPGTRRLLQGNTWALLRSRSRTVSPNSATRTAIDTWCTNAGLTVLPAGAVTWRDVILHVARQVEPAADLDEGDDFS